MGNFVNRRINNPFLALKNPNFALYWCLFCISTIGTWMQNIAQPWLAYSLTGSPLLLSVVGALQYTPVLLFSLFAGVILDRFPKKNILLITQCSSAIITLIPAILILTHTIQYWHIVVLATMLGVVNAFDITARQTFVIEIVGKEHTMNAVALNSAVFNSARVIGPAIAGLIMAFWDVAWCFIINSISFAIMFIGLFFIKPSYVPEKSETIQDILSDVKEGIDYMFKKKILYDTIIKVAIVATFAMNLQVLLPVFTKGVLQGKETGFGLLMSCMGIGSFLGAMGVATTSKSGPHNFNLVSMPWLIALMAVITGFSTSFYMAATCLFLTGFFFVSFSSSSNSNVQLNSGDRYRGRVMSIYTLVFAGSTPFGNLYAGFITNHFGPRAGFWACGGAVLLLLTILLVVEKSKGKSE